MTSYGIDELRADATEALREEWPVDPGEDVQIEALLRDYFASRPPSAEFLAAKAYLGETTD